MQIAGRLQGYGAGSALLKDAERRASETGCNRLNLHTKNPKFYLDRGYQERQGSDHMMYKILPSSVRLRAHKESESVRAAEHLKDVCCLFGDWACKCRLAKQQHQNSCLDVFSKVDLLKFHRETYGQDDRTVSLASVTKAIHTALWGLKEKLPERDGYGRHYKIPAFSSCRCSCDAPGSFIGSMHRFFNSWHLSHSANFECRALRA